MKVAFRVDASIEMGIGHVMRCLTLADALKAEGAQCHFVCREHPGHLLGQIIQRGHLAHPLPLCDGKSLAENNDGKEPVLSHAVWLGCHWHNDYAQTLDALKNIQPDWFIVDHYALDSRWERQIRSVCKKIMVIDDLADRSHDCDLLLDQTFGRVPQVYEKLVPAGCTILTGSKFALLRPEFAAMRQYSLLRRETPRIGHVLISMGGVDKTNATGKVLQALRETLLPKHCRITVVMGDNSPWLAEVSACAEALSWPTEVKLNVDNMAQLMADSDLAIGAAGSTSWERCCLGVPTLIMVLADNQREIALALKEKKAIRLLNDNVLDMQISEISTDILREMSCSARNITDGCGTSLVVHYLKEM